MLPPYTKLLRSRLDLHQCGLFGIARVKGGASYGLGEHPIAEELRVLE